MPPPREKKALFLPKWGRRQSKGHEEEEEPKRRSKEEEKEEDRTEEDLLSSSHRDEGVNAKFPVRAAFAYFLLLTFAS